MDLVEALPGGTRVGFGRESLACTTERIRQVGSHDFKYAQFVQEARAASEKNVMRELVPLGALTSVVTAVEGWIQRCYGRRAWQMPTGFRQHAACGSKRFCQISNRTRCDFSTLARANELAVGAQSERFVESYREDPISVFPLADDGFEQIFFAGGKKRRPVLTYGTADNRRPALFCPKHDDPNRGGHYSR